MRSVDTQAGKGYDRDERYAKTCLCPVAEILCSFKIRGELNPMRFLLCLLGLVLFVEGLPYVISPGKMKTWMAAIQEIPNSRLRGLGLLAMALGLLVTYFFK